MSNLMRVVGSSVAIAKEAGSAIRKILLGGKLGIIDKDDVEEFDPQTEADRSAQRLIIGSLSKLYPDLVIIGEEEGCDTIERKDVIKEIDAEVMQQNFPEKLNNIQLKDIVVWVDPLDATREFTEGFVENVTVLIGISAYGKAIAGVIHQPFHQKEVGKTFWGVVGLGAFGFDYMEPPENSNLRLITSKSHWSDALRETFEGFPDAVVTKAGGSGYKALKVIDGSQDVYLYPQRGTKKWDSCAPEAILRSAGGIVTDCLGQDIDYAASEKRFHVNWTGLLASKMNSESHMKLAQKIPENIQQALKNDFIAKTQSKI